jgi:hypothetical protein
MKNSKTFIYCEYCDKPHIDDSSPTAEQYYNGLIHIEKGSIILLDVKNKKHPSHSKFIDGVYCNSRCLLSHLDKIRSER